MSVPAIPIPIIPPGSVVGLGETIAKASPPISLPGADTLGTFARAGEVLTSPNFWKRAGVIALGGYLLYISILLWVASNDKVQSAVGAAVTKNPSAAVAAVKGA